MIIAILMADVLVCQEFDWWGHYTNKMGKSLKLYNWMHDNQNILSKLLLWQRHIYSILYVPPAYVTTQVIIYIFLWFTWLTTQIKWQKSKGYVKYCNYLVYGNTVGKTELH